MTASIWALLLALPSDATEIKLSVSAPEGVLHPGKAMNLRFELENTGAKEAQIDEPENYLSGLEIWNEAGQKLRSPSKEKPPVRRRVPVPARGFFGRTVDISSVFDVPVEKEGFFRMRWSFGEATSNEIQVLVLRDWTAEIETSLGTILLEFRPDLAPHHVLNFVGLARSGFYTGSLFHRIIPGFMMQGGQPRDPSQALKVPLKAEFSGVHHGFGTVSAARGTDRNSATSEFFICFGPAPHLDGLYSVFGQVIGGEEVVREFEKVKTDHSPCAGCGLMPRRPGANSCCGQAGHHADKPLADVYIKKITISERK